MKVRQALVEAERRLAEVPGQPRQDAELLMAAALGVSAGEMKLRHLDDPVPGAFDNFLRRRLAREPVAYIVGHAGFWTIELEVGPGVLIPRADSETLMEAAVDHFRGRAPSTMLDLGTGPGTLLLAALDQWPGARGFGVDRSAQALDYARRNADRLGMADRAEWRLGDWAEGLDGMFDLVLCNPPYIECDAPLDPDVVEWEPHGALFAGADGLDDYRRLAGQFGRLVAPGGVACVEIGQGQEDAVGELFAATAFTISSRKDLRGVTRCLVLRR
ncbi:MAG: peptide chain release factor N(5)-glutamine methyltransferase [Allosphingosinicella sp.]|uniref:peptide chain release factor N(5)-glutamine methyltransferase n=1 Tax=Allosphingosinicella sp. TaxID=2823234 RepID=UPI00392E472A